MGSLGRHAATLAREPLTGALSGVLARSCGLRLVTVAFPTGVTVRTTRSVATAIALTMTLTVVVPLALALTMTLTVARAVSGTVADGLAVAIPEIGRAHV